jgi:hypothetical protein
MSQKRQVTATLAALGATIVASYMIPTQNIIAWSEHHDDSQKTTKDQLISQKEEYQPSITF